MKMPDSKEKSLKEQRVRKTAPSYYSRQDIRKAIFKFSKNRETIPRYYEGFGKRPSSFQYESDILALVKKGATSFHCSEELWQDPLSISTDMSEQEIGNLRQGWDLLIDIDCPYLEYSKQAALALIKAFEFHKVYNVGLKFSGSKGFHLIVPWKAFPKQIHDKKTKDMFPQWPRLICQYLMQVARPILEKTMEDEEEKFTSKLKKGVRCETCKNIAEKIEKTTVKCSACGRQETFKNYEKTKRKCPECRLEMQEKNKKTIYYCQNCDIDSEKYPDNFKEKSSIDIFKVLGIDVVLVSPRHLFRMPYSLHEKTALSSIVLNKKELENFSIHDADPLKVKVKDFLPKAEENEARELLLQAIDWGKEKQEPETNKNKGKYEEIIIKNLSPNLYPPCITKILKGVKEDGRKRALFILINFFKSLKLSFEEIEKKINNWNKKNYKPLKQGYINSQLSWHKRQEAVLPPNCDKPHYKDLQLCQPDNLCRTIKNPVNYTIKKNFILRKKSKK